MNRFPYIQPALLAILKLSLLGLLAFSLGGYLADYHYGLEQLCHFRFQYGVIAGFFALAFAAVLNWRWTSLSVFGLLINIGPVAPLYWPEPDLQASAAKPDLRIILANVHTANRNFTDILKWVRTEQPDIFIAQEIDDNWLAQLNMLTDQMPYRLAFPRRDNFGIGLWSRLPFVQDSLVILGSAGVPSILAQIEVDGQKVSLLTMHPLPPVDGKYALLRNEQLQSAAVFLNSLTAPKLLVGDLNVTPFSPYLQRLEQQTDLRQARRGRGLLPTWPTVMPLLMIPIDHYLISPDMRVVDLRTGPNIGSDHLPLLLEATIFAGDGGEGMIK